MHSLPMNNQNDNMNIQNNNMNHQNDNMNIQNNLHQAQSMFNEALNLRALGCNEEALPLLNQVLHFRRNNHCGTRHEQALVEVAEVYDESGEVHFAMASFEEATENFQQAQIRYSEVHGSDHHLTRQAA